MTDKCFPFSKLPIRKLIKFLPKVCQTEANNKLLGGSAAQLNLENLAVNTLIN
jgi:hypothetical protein